MAQPCGMELGHGECNYPFIIAEHKGHKAAPDAWRSSKNKAYQKKRKAQIK